MKKLRVQNGHYGYSFWSYSLMRVCTFDQFSKYLSDLPPAATVLDYGAGDRPYQEILQARYKRYLAADYAATHHSYAQAPDVVLDGETIPLESGSVNCVVLTEVLEHVYNPKQIVRELNRILTPGGYLIGTVPFAIQEHDEPYDFHRYTYFCLKRMFVDGGFEIEHLDYVGDLVAVCISTCETALDVLPKTLAKAKLGFLASALRAIFKIPGFVYYNLRKTSLNPGRSRYFQRYPMSFSFCLKKSAV